jgi:hypothetical protein
MSALRLLLLSCVLHQSNRTVSLNQSVRAGSLAIVLCTMLRVTLRSSRERAPGLLFCPQATVSVFDCSSFESEPNHPFFVVVFKLPQLGDCCREEAPWIIGCAVAI